MSKATKALLKEVDNLIAKGNPSKKAMAILEDIVEDLEDKKKAKKEGERKEYNEKLLAKFDSLGKALAGSKLDTKAVMDGVTKAIGSIKVSVPKVNVEAPKVDVNVPKQPKVEPPVVVVPDTVTVRKPSWLPSLKPITDKLKEIKDAIPSIKFPSYADEAIPVKLSDGKEFYRAMGGSGGSLSIPTFKNAAGEVVQALVDSSGKLNTSLVQNVVADTNNSSTTNLTAGATFTGTSSSTLGVVGLQWSLKTSENCTVYIDQSDDETNWDLCDTFNYYTSVGGRGETVQALKSYWRIRVKNIGASTTTYFRLAGVLCPIASPLPRALTPTGRLKVSNENINVEIPKGDVVGHSAVNKFGANSDIAAGATEEIWDGNRVYIFPTTASITHIRSAVDSAITRGVVCEIQGLDNTYTLVVQNVTTDVTNSTTEVILPTALRRVFRVKVLDDTAMDQDLWVGPDPASAANASAIVQAGNNQTLMAIYCVPAGKTAYMTQWKATVNPATGKDPTSMPIRMWARDNANNYAKQLKDIQGLIVGTLRVPYEPYYKFTEKTDIYFTASPVGKAADVSLGFDLILVDDE